MKFITFDYDGITNAITVLADKVGAVELVRLNLGSGMMYRIFLVMDFEKSYTYGTYLTLEEAVHAKVLLMSMINGE